MEPESERKLIKDCAEYFKALGFLVCVDKEVIKGKTQYGKTDVIAYKDTVIYAIECKFINNKNRTRKRKKVKDQSLIYASILKWKYPDRIVKAYVFTNEGLQFLQLMTIEESTNRCLEYFRHVGLRLNTQQQREVSPSL
jgi:Holliday junction resolvase